MFKFRVEKIGMYVFFFFFVRAIKMEITFSGKPQGESDFSKDFIF